MTAETVFMTHDVPEAIADNPVALEVFWQQEELSPLQPPTERAELFRKVVAETPLIPVAPDLVPGTEGYSILVKYEGAQPGGAYKIRGATNALQRAMEANPDMHTVTVASTGNHANTTAIAAQALGVPNVQVMCPQGTSPAKLDAMRQNGARVDTHFATLPDALAAAQRTGEAPGVVYVDPYNAEATIAGQGTAAQEVVLRLREMEAMGELNLERDEVIFFVPGGGGGCAAGNAVAMAAHCPTVKVVVSQMEGCEGIAAAQHGERLDPARVDTSCDGAAVALPGDKPMSIINDARFVDTVRVVKKHEVGRAMRLLSGVHKPPEPAGALAFAAMLQHIQEYPAANDGRRRLLIPMTSGINVTPAKLAEFARAEFDHMSNAYAARKLSGLQEALRTRAEPPTTTRRRGRVLCGTVVRP